MSLSLSYPHSSSALPYGWSRAFFFPKEGDELPQETVQSVHTHLTQGWHEKRRTHNTHTHTHTPNSLACLPVFPFEPGSIDPQDLLMR